MGNWNSIALPAIRKLKLDASKFPDPVCGSTLIPRDSECLPLNESGRSIAFDELDTRFSGRARNVEIDRPDTDLNLQDRCGGQRITMF